MVKKFLHIEGLTVLLAVIYIYSLYEFSWWIFLLLILSPDVSMLAYLINDRIGAKVYNAFHTYIVSIFMISLAIFLKEDAWVMIGLIWTAHIGMDRLFGYGLKYTSSFKDTHMQRL
ncbi:MULTISPECIES: DUF4260 domain-containing protein [unclassified Bacillus (in: firmicutes)]|uniref:DUF4260 domain-containing protein n=1 Tax=unclassified Bacillus (in: firmicutes) TaxID=185979 RepID=UPI001BE75960|nr:MULTISPECIES: DUF4260 domain-containing protein [unclassified Bacillus (in: firmicutes)]MBT2617940.1 DUF4260 domain-containing protein [Bacillus sp. ISL-78]MBT2631217.1 DUF4260 domain-containing protein [Bacillus sp. ISL-101]